VIDRQKTVGWVLVILSGAFIAYFLRIRPGDYLRLIMWTPIYQLLLSYAALRAVGREMRGQGGWEKTEHTGVSLGNASAAMQVGETA